MIFPSRFLKKNRAISLINILGMATGLAVSGIILTFVHQEYHFDSNLKNAEQIYRVIEKDGESQDEYGYAPLAEALREEFPEIEASVRMAFYYGFLACRAGENSFNERSAIFADPNFFRFFSFPLTQGDPEFSLSDLWVLPSMDPYFVFGSDGSGSQEEHRLEEGDLCLKRRS